MAFHLSNLAIGRGEILPGDTLQGYLVRYRLVLYVLPATVVAAGVRLELHWLTASTLLRLLTALPCLLMMLRCMTCATRSSNEDVTRPDRTLSSPEN